MAAPTVSVPAAPGVPAPVAPPGPPALRWRRPGWRDPRLLLGVVLVAAAVALGSSTVAAAARSVPVYAASGTLVPGDTVAVGDLVVREVRLGPVTDRYLRADADLPADLVVVRVVGEGELVPAAAVAPSARLDVRPLAVEPSGLLPEGVARGATVDLWFVPERPGGVAETPAAPPRELARGLTVAGVSEPATGLALGTGVTVHVLVPVDDLADVLAALADEGAVEVVLVPGGAP